MADPALAEPAAAHPELADPAARLPLRREDPDGFMPAAGVVATLTRYARLAGAPVRTATAVRTVRATAQGFEIQANDDLLHARAVVLATGACGLPAIPGDGYAVPRRSRRSRRSPIAIPGSSRGRRARRRRIRHRRPARRRDPPVRAPGDACGRRTRPAAPQLPRPRHLLVALANTCALADLKMNRFLNRADAWAKAAGLDGLPPPVLRTRASSYIHGAGTDSAALAGHLHSFLPGQCG